MIQKRQFVYFLLLIFTLCARGTIYQRRQEKQILDNILSSVNYDARIRPPSNTTGEPIEIRVSLHVLNIHSIDDHKMLYSLDLYFREEWIDERLRFATSNGIKYITLDDEEIVWTPDLFFNDYEAHPHEITRPNTFLRIHTDGSIMLSRRYNLVLYCPMDLSKYPFDHHVCPMVIESYAWKADEVLLNWKNPSSEAVTVSNDLHIPLFSLEDTMMSSGKGELLSGTYTHLTLSFIFSRELNYYLTTIFLPCIMMMILAYFMFWIDIKQFGARLILGIVTLYACSISVARINSELPKSSYTKAVDVFTGLSITFIFIAVIETIFVYFIENKRGEVNGEGKGNINDLNDVERTKLKKVKDWMIENSSNNIDAASRVVYPILFVLFQIIYWCVCLSFQY